MWKEQSLPRVKRRAYAVRYVMDTRMLGQRIEYTSRVGPFNSRSDALLWMHQVKFLLANLPFKATIKGDVEDMPWGGREFKYLSPIGARDADPVMFVLLRATTEFTRVLTNLIDGYKIEVIVSPHQEQ